MSFMDTEISVAAQLPPDRGIPVLNPHSRKIRHITGIVLRNLAINANKQASKSTKPTADEISTDLISPSRRRSRRAASLQIISDTESSSLMDSMAVLYAENQIEPIYISEPSFASNNPSFHEFDLSCIQKKNGVNVNLDIYGRPTAARSTPIKILSSSFDLASLVFIGRSFDSITCAFYPNTFILILKDGCYTLSKYLVFPLLDASITRPMSPALMNTLSFDEIRKLTLLDDSLADNRMTISRIDGQLKDLTDNNTNYITNVAEKDQLSHEIWKIRKTTDRVRMNTSSIRKKTASLNEKSRKIHQQLTTQREKLGNVNKSVTNMHNDTIKHQMAIKQIPEALKYERWRAVSSLEKIFPIEPVHGKPLLFSICGTELPNIIETRDLHVSVHDNEIGAAFGYVAQLLFFLSLYLDVPLRYPIQPYGSTSFIIDPISTIQGSRVFPLWTKGSIFYRFEYAVHLVRKCIEQLINSQGVMVSDLRYTLANLKNLYLIISNKVEKSR